MSLIDKLGGYERAKSVVNNCPKNGMFYRDMDSVCDPLGILYYVWFGCSLLVFDKDKGWIKSIYHDGNEYIADQLESLDELRKEILQYRREHGIFEIGDKVIWCDEDFCIVDKVYTCGMIGIDAGYERFGIGKHNLKHATDLEIAAGHHINNHELEDLELVDVSPCCKKIGDCDE